MIIRICIGLGRSGDMIIEISGGRTDSAAWGATLVGLPYTRPIGMDPDDGRDEAAPRRLSGSGLCCRKASLGYYLPGYVKTDKTQEFPLFGYTAVVWKDGGFYVAAEQSDDPEPWNPQQLRSVMSWSIR